MYQLLLTELVDPNRTEASCLKAKRILGKGDLYQRLTIGSLREATCVKVYPERRLSRTRKGRRTSIKVCIWTEHSACISQIQISAYFFFLQIEPNTIYVVLFVNGLYCKFAMTCFSPPPLFSVIGIREKTVYAWQSQKKYHCFNFLGAAMFL